VRTVQSQFDGWVSSRDYRGMQTETAIPDALTEPVAAALNWINATHQRDYEVTGLVDAESALDAPQGSAIEVGLVLCDGEICQRQQVRIQPDGDRYQFALVEAGARAIPPLLDPPQKVRSEWLANMLGEHEFVLLLFYRGLW